MEEIATLGGGCFWCVEAVYLRIPGVFSVSSGYAGGNIKSPTYKQICTGTTGHAEVIQIKFDPSLVTYAQVLDIFWRAHDPTTLNRQGNDIGTQYRSVIFYHSQAQHAAAETSMREAAYLFKNPIKTEIVTIPEFYIAEEYHQNYFELNPKDSYCNFMILPKLEKLGLKL